MQSSPYVRTARMHNTHLMTLQVIWCTWLWYTASFSHLCGKILKITFKTSIFLPYILDLLDITSQRKLAHIQRLILLNLHFKSITRYTCRHLSLGNMRPVSTTGPKVYFILFLYFSRTQLLAYSLEKYQYLVLAPRPTTIQLTHGCE